MCRFEIKADVAKEYLSDSVIEELVETVFEDTQLRSIPVKIIPIVKYYGFAVFQSAMPDNESGYIIVSEKTIEGFNAKKVIVFNSNHSDRRNRFTVAHELAHYIFHASEELYAHRDAGDSSIEEVNANSFASALLMPKKELESAVKQIKNEFFDSVPESVLVSRIADEFNVSRQAAEVRLRKSGLKK